MLKMSVKINVSCLKKFSIVSGVWLDFGVVRDNFYPSKTIYRLSKAHISRFRFKNVFAL